LKDFSKLKTLLKIKSDTEKRNLNTFFNEQFCLPKGSENVRIPRMLLPKSRDTDPPHLKKQCEVPQGVRIVSMKNIS
jgi:hypothetical protein